MIVFHSFKDVPIFGKSYYLVPTLGAEYVLYINVDLSHVELERYLSKQNLSYIKRKMKY